MTTETAILPGARYTWGGDEFLFVEVSEAMSLPANFKVMSIAGRLSDAGLPGIVDICPANASLLVRFDPDVLPPEQLETAVRDIERDLTSHQERALETRIVEVPVWYEDPFTAEVAQRFREGFHQEPEGSDIDYAAKVNHLKDAAEFIQRHHEQPWLVSMVGFVAGLPFLFQLVDREKQLEVPKYLSPRTDTPKLTVGHGGCFGCIYSVRGAGGYQMFGVAAAPIFDPGQALADFKDFMVFFRPGDIVKFKPVTEAEYNTIQAEISAGTFRYRQAPVTFDLSRALADPEGYNRELMEALNGI
ncbi:MULTISPECIES: 5-oxoprolinase subunit B family protein [Pseudarthrobacter]|uniref:Urea carboxylase n=1 Tax=Pseudarthrobacter niigatensis TaxID=369935 RepID=A0AAJ1T0V3_9MICC|nr:MULTISPECIES: allophanate hydrolase subunit 1 [Pseudarthrobacter]MDQ0147347.1 urea carboxylase [Pseudarthrobacter niigatensis]MDQ0267164.1 urea carboxylase [Pseudarthrobacter niigatensis]QDG87498.1 allophanate hydrolase subunit 1 [Pseudarthrobacter sp. NIBRBAC000502770]